MAELIPNGKKRMSQITEAREKLKDTISVYVTGNHNALTTQIMEKNFIVSSKGTEEYGLVARPLQDQEFKESIRNIAEKPSVIVHIENIEDGDTFEVNVLKCSMLGKSFSGRHFEIFFLFFSEDRF